MSFTPNPHEHSNVTIDNRSVFARIREWYGLPFPVRCGNENPIQWIVDAIVAVLLYIGGSGIADLCRQTLPFLEPIAYSVGFIIGFYPMGMWIHYCRVTRFTRSTVLLLVSFLLAFKAAAAGMDGLYSLPLACAVLVVALPCEHLLGKLIIGWLPSSSTKKQREQTIEHEALDRPL